MRRLRRRGASGGSISDQKKAARDGQGAISIAISCRISPVARSKIRIRSSRVTTAYHVGPCVKAAAVAPEGRVIVSGSGGAEAGACRRMTSMTTMDRRPRIIVAVRTVTSHLR